MKKIITYLLSLFGFGKKNTETTPSTPTGHPSNMNYWEHRGLVSTTTLREHLEKIVMANNTAENTPIKCEIEQLAEYDLSIDNNLILPYRSQKDKVIQLFLWNLLVSTKEANKAGLSRLPKIVSELRKGGWGIKTFVFYNSGKKIDIVYALTESNDDNLAGETAVVK